MDASRTLNRIAATGALLLWVAACGSGGGSTPAPTATPPAGFAYVANELDNTVSIYSVGAGGQLSALGYVPAGTSPLSVTVDPQSRFAYAANLGSADVSAYAINATTGALTPISCMPGGTAVCTGSNFTAEAGATSVVIHPSGKFAYVANFTASNVSQYAIASSGALTPLAASAVAAGTNASAIAVHPAGAFAYVANYTSNDVSAYRIDATGALTRISCGPPGTAGCSGATEPTDFAAGTNPFSLAIDPARKFAYVTNYGSSDISAYTINTTTGALTQVSCGPVGTPGCTGTTAPTNFANGTGAISIVVDPTGKFAYAANLASNDVSAYAIDPPTGALTHISCGTPGTAGCVGTTEPTNFAAGRGANAVAIDPTGKFAYVANLDSNNVSAYTIDAAGKLTPISCGAVGTQGCSGTTLPTLFAAGTAPVSLVVAKPGTSTSLPSPAP